MFCSKCGTQLPNEAKFCPSCGNQLYVQPTAPIMSVTPVIEAPVAPVMEAPVIEAPVVEAPVVEAPVAEAPVAEAPVVEAPVVEAPVVEAPIVGAPVVEAPVAEIPFMPVADPFMNAPTNFIKQSPVNNETVATTPKKSKAPLFIILGIIGLIIAIVAIILILVLGNGDDKKKKKSNTTVDPTEVTTEEKSTAEDPTEEETSSNSGSAADEGDIDDAKTMVENFMTAVDASNYSKASKYLLPALTEAMEDLEYMDADKIVEELAILFSDSNGDVFDYEITDVYIEDSYYFDEVTSTLDDYPSYEEPSNYAEAQIYFTYGTQCSYFYLELAYVDGDWYIFDYDDDYFNIILESETDPSLDTDSDFDFDTAINENYMELTTSVEGFTEDFGDFNLTVPEGWARSDEYVYDSAYENTISVDTWSLDGQTKEEYLRESCDLLIESQVTDLDFGNITAINETGYYVEFSYNDSYVFAIIFFNEAEDTAYEVAAVSSNPDSDNCRIAEAIAASFNFK